MSRYLPRKLSPHAADARRDRARAKDGERSSLAVAQGFVRNQGDAWTWTLDQFNRAIDDLATRQAAGDAVIDEIADYTAIAAAIGRRLGEMHAALAQPSRDAAFAPETASERDVEDGPIARPRCSTALSLAQEADHWESETAEAEAKRLCRTRRADARVAQARRSGIGTAKTRIHGDFHLGTGAGRERRCLHHRLRGRAGTAARRAPREGKPLARCRGLLRSFDYAAAAVLDPNSTTAAYVSQEQRVAVRDALRDAAKRAFLDRLPQERCGGLACPSLLDFFLIEKAAYELGYEAANRPAGSPSRSRASRALPRVSFPARSEA
jgi:maltose alpha-D-glucosyltransferase/alpha-amylase